MKAVRLLGSPLETFSLSRALEYLSEPELTRQIGHLRHSWKLAILKELLDNSVAKWPEKKSNF